MALSLSDLKAHCNITANTDDALLTRLLAVATKHVERLLGFTLESMEGGAPADLEHAVYMLAREFYENREASLVGVTAQAVPFGVQDIVNEYRNYTFGLPCEEEGDGE